MGIVNATGRLRIRWSGPYTALLAFESPAAAQDALAVLGDPWMVTTANNRVLAALLTDEQVEDFKTRFSPEVPLCTHASCKRRRKADRVHEINGIEHSLDYGPEFKVAIRVTPSEQVRLAV